MKQAYLLLLSALLSTAAVAQWNVPEENKGMITKITASWCGPCGGWGWDGFQDLLDNHHNDHIMMALYASSSSLFYTPDADVIAQEIGFGGYPNFAGNGEDVGTAYSSVSGIVDPFLEETVHANAAYEVINVTEDQIEIKVKVKFFEAMDGTFVVAGYVIEDEVIGFQQGQGEDANHHVVFRGAFSAENDDYIVTDEDADAGETFTKNMTIERNPEWNIEHLEIATVLWKQDSANATDLIYVNGTGEPQAGEIAEGGGTNGGGGGTTGGSDDPRTWPVGVEDVALETVELFPNPARDVLNVRLNSSTDFVVEMTDLLGKMVLQQTYTGKSSATVDVAQLPEGIYMIKVATATDAYLDRVIVK